MSLLREWLTRGGSKIDDNDNSTGLSEFKDELMDEGVEDVYRFWVQYWTTKYWKTFYTGNS